MPTVDIGANADPHTEHHFGFFRLNAVGGSLTRDSTTGVSRLPCVASGSLAVSTHPPGGRGCEDTIFEDVVMGRPADGRVASLGMGGPRFPVRGRYWSRRCTLITVSVAAASAQSV